MRIILLGPPGAGKGTQAERLCALHRAAHVSTGEMLRRSAEMGSRLGLKAKALIDAGQFVPDEVAIGIVAERLSQPDAADRFVLDGFPRTAAQAVALDALLESSGIGLDAAVELRVDEAALLARIEARAAQASARGDIPRADDTAETLALRLRDYAHRTRPVVNHYRGRGLLRGVDAMGRVEEVALRIGLAVDGYGKAA